MSKAQDTMKVYRETGAPLFICTNKLAQCEGDVEKAIELIRTGPGSSGCACNIGGKLCKPYCFGAQMRDQHETLQYLESLYNASESLYNADDDKIKRVKAKIAQMNADYAKHKEECKRIDELFYGKANEEVK